MQKYYLIFNQNFERNWFYYVLFLLVFIPLYPKFPILSISNTFVAVRAEDILIFLFFIGWLIKNITKLRYFKSKTIFQSIILFWGIGLLSLISAVFLTYSVLPHLGFLHWLRRIEYMGLFLVTATLIKNEQNIKLILKTFFLTAVFVSLYGYGQMLLNFPVVSTSNSEFSKGIILYLTNGARVSSTFAGHYDLAIYLSIIITMSLSILFYYRNVWRKLFFLLLTSVFHFILLGFTAARVSFVATMLGLFVVFWFNKQKKMFAVLVLLSLLVMIAIPELRHRLVATVTVNLLGGGGPKYNPPQGTVTIFTPLRGLDQTTQKAMKEKAIKESTDPAKKGEVKQVDTAPGEPINTTELGVYRSFGIRFNVEWPRAMNAFLKNPLLGTGYSSIGLATDNDILRSLAESGLMGTISFGLIFFILIRRMIKFIKTNEGFEKFFIGGVLCSLLVVFLTALFIDVFESSKVAELIWIILGASWAVMSGYKEENI